MPAILNMQNHVLFRHGHQVTLVMLSNLKHEAFLLAPGPHNGEAEQRWTESMASRSPTFRFWLLVMKYETLILMFVRAHRERNFLLYVAVLEKLAPLFFALDHVNYSRWLPVHIEDMRSLPQAIQKQFIDGHWVISKTKHPFSSMPIDQAHEQENRNVKGSGGAVGLTENPVAFRYGI